MNTYTLSFSILQDYCGGTCEKLFETGCSLYSVKTDICATSSLAVREKPLLDYLLSNEVKEGHLLHKSTALNDTNLAVYTAE